MVQNYVVDFFYFSLIDFPIFNVADCYVVIGCFLFALLIFFYYKDEDLDFIFPVKRKQTEEKLINRRISWKNLNFKTPDPRSGSTNF